MEGGVAFIATVIVHRRGSRMTTTSAETVISPLPHVYVVVRGRWRSIPFVAMALFP